MINNKTSFHECSWPVKVTHFSGDLIPAITKHYNTVLFSPLIEYRKNICILIDNKTYQLYDLQTFKFPKLCCKFAIEFPHMCYISVSEIRLKIKPSYTKDDNFEVFKHVNLNIGQDYVKNYVNSNITECDFTIGTEFINVNYVCTDEQKNKIGVYAEISFGNIMKFNTFYLHECQIIGSAVSLI